MSKRPATLDSFFSPPATKRSRIKHEDDDEPRTVKSEFKSRSSEVSNHSTYPFPVPHLPEELKDVLNFSPAEEGRIINNQPDLDLLYFQPYVPKETHRSLFEFLRDQLFFYRVTYPIKRGGFETTINTPRFLLPNMVQTHLNFRVYSRTHFLYI